jgi:hypothetical protein
MWVLYERKIFFFCLEFKAYCVKNFELLKMKLNQLQETTTLALLQATAPPKTSINRHLLAALPIDSKEVLLALEASVSDKNSQELILSLVIMIS